MPVATVSLELSLCCFDDPYKWLRMMFCCFKIYYLSVRHCDSEILKKISLFVPKVALFCRTAHCRLCFDFSTFVLWISHFKLLHNDEYRKETESQGFCLNFLLCHSVPHTQAQGKGEVRSHWQKKNDSTQSKLDVSITGWFVVFQC